MTNIKYTFNENIFEQIDTPEKAYWIGFLYADGSIHTNSNTLALTLKESDKEHLQHFEHFLNIEPSCLKYQSDSKAWRFQVTREKIWKDLYSIGFTPSKTYDKTLIVWNHIPNQYKKDFLLGLWDGDGSFYISKEGKQGASLISNNDILIYVIAKYINQHLGENFCKVKERTDGDPYPRIQILYNKAKIFGEWLYQEVSYPTLQRKYDIYKKMKIREKAHYGFDNPKTKGVICTDNGKAYITAKQCCIKEFGLDSNGAINLIGSVCRGERKQTRGKHFRYMTKEELEEFKNGRTNF